MPPLLPPHQSGEFPLNLSGITPSLGDAITVNPVTDVVTVPIAAGREKAKSDNPFEALGSALGSMLGGALAKALEPSFERELNLRAREGYDVYAILLPYRVRIVTGEERKETPTP